MMSVIKTDLLPRSRVHRSIWQMTLQQFLRHRMAVASIFVLVVIVLSAVFAPVLSPEDPLRTQASNKFQPPSRAHLLGTDDMGRDVLSRLLFAGRVSLTVGFLATFVSLAFGMMVGALAGYFGGLVDNLLMRLTDLFLSFPTLFVLILLSSLLREGNLNFLRSGMLPVVFVIAILSWMGLARLVRAAFLSLREEEYVVAARAVGARHGHIVLRHILPNSLSTIIVNTTLFVAYSIITESGLSYLGFGIQPPTPTWGNMLNRAQTYVYMAPWMGIFPGLMIFFTVISINYIGDGLRDAFDPRTIR